MAGLQPDIYAAISITWVAAFLALGLRLKARRMTKMNLWFDDYFAVIALLVSLCYDPFFVTFFQDSRRRKSQPKRRSVYQTLFYRG
ncbi:hypothetical protein NW765_010127 [Fusarium oxysporum]|nr:hypothetical protein NW765_010127 [Fusarium oxysporum]